MKNPKISIIIPSYNYENYIEDAIKSVLAQTFSDFELIIVDDGSNDNSVEVIKKYVGGNVRFYTHENNQNKGLSATVQLGINKSQGEYVAFLECDDFWVKTYLEEKINVFETYPEVGIVFSDVEVLGDENRINLLKDYFDICRKRCVEKIYPSSLNYECLMLELISNFSSVMIKKNVFEGIDFNPPIAPYLDWWVLSQITFKNKAYFINKRLTNLRLHTKSYIENTKSKITVQNKKDMFKMLLDLLKNESKDNEYNELIDKIFSEKVGKFTRDYTFKDNFIENFVGKKMFLYGAGSFLRETLKDYDFTGLNIQGVIDADKNKIGQSILGYKIYNKEEIVELKPDVILISMQQPEIIYSDLRNFILEKGLKTSIITDFFNDVRFKALNDKSLSREEILAELF